MTPPTPETLLTPDGVQAGVAARLTAYTRGQRRGPLTGDVYLWAYSAALAGWRASELRLAEAEKYHDAAEALLAQMDWGKSFLTGEAIAAYNDAAVAYRKHALAPSEPKDAEGGTP